MIRLFDVIFSFIGLLVGSPILLALMLACWLDTKSPIFKQERVGRFQKPFYLYKFRTMGINTQSIATHLVNPSVITRLGSFLRKSKLDELPQLWNILRGNMSLVGPRPCLYSQKELIHQREIRGVFNALPGITGLSQINKVDMSTPERLAEFDAKMLASLNAINYFRYLFSTMFGRGFGDRVKNSSK